MAAVGTGAVDDSGLALEDRLEQVREVLRVVLEVRVEDREEVAGRLGEAASERGALALVDRLLDEPDRTVLHEVLDRVDAPVGRAVVHHQHLGRQRHVDREQAVEGAAQRRPLVEARA